MVTSPPMRIRRAALFSIATGLVVCFGPVAARAETIVQIPLTGVLDARSVTTLTAGNLVVFDLPTDGGDLMNAFATKAVALSKGQPAENALPDDGKFPGNARHPEVVLHFANDAPATSKQTHKIKVAEAVKFDVPVATYSKFFLFFNGAAGGTMVTATLNYADSMATQMVKVPDYFNDVPDTDPVIFNLASNLAKWTMDTAINEKAHHNITGVELKTRPDKMLSSIQITRANDGGTLLLWGATGVATSEVASGGAAGSSGAGGGGAGAGGSGGIAGAASGGGATAGATSGGATTLGGTSGTSNGGSSGTTTASGGVAGNATAVVPPATTGDTDSGCGCRVRASDADAKPWPLLVLGACLALRRRRAPRYR